MFNIFSLAFFAIVVAIGLAIYITRQKKPGSPIGVLPEEGFDPSRLIRMSDVFAVAERICDANALKIKERLNVSERETYWIAESVNPVFFGSYVFGFLEADSQQPLVILTTLLEFKDFIKSVGSTKGFYFTNGFFTRDVHQPLEGPKVALYNAVKVEEEHKRLGVSDGH